MSPFSPTEKTEGPTVDPTFVSLLVELEQAIRGVGGPRSARCVEARTALTDYAQRYFSPPTPESVSLTEKIRATMPSLPQLDEAIGRMLRSAMTLGDAATILNAIAALREENASLVERLSQRWISPMSEAPRQSDKASPEEAIPKILAAYQRSARDLRPWWVRRWAQAICKHRNIEPWYHAWYCLDCGKVTHD